MRRSSIFSVYSPSTLPSLSRRKLLQYGALALGTGILSACSAQNSSSESSDSLFQSIQDRGYFTYGLEAGYRPFEFYDENNQLIGYDIDLAQALATKWGVESRPIPTNWATVIQTLYDGGFDFILGGMTATAERYERVNFSIPYMDASSGLLVRMGDGITDRPSLAGRLVGTKAGTPSINQLEITQEELGIQYAEPIKTFPEDIAGVEALRSGRIDAYASSMVSLLEVKKENPDFDVIPFQSEKWAAEFTCAAFRKEDEDLQNAFNEAILAMQADGSLSALQTKWFGRSFDELPKEAPTW